MEYKGLIIGQCNRKESFFHLTCCKIWLPIWDVVFWAVRERRDNQKSQTYKPTNLLFLKGVFTKHRRGIFLNIATAHNIWVYTVLFYLFE